MLKYNTKPYWSKKDHYGNINVFINQKRPTLQIKNFKKPIVIILYLHHSRQNAAISSTYGRKLNKIKHDQIEGSEL